MDVLQQGGCSELISLDLRGNTLSADAQSLLVRLNHSLAHEHAVQLAVEHWLSCTEGHIYKACPR